MTKRGTSLPEKLKDDAIIEVVFEIRFKSPTIPEVFYGRFVDHKYWKGFTQRRLPMADFPLQFRQIDPNILFSPSIELVAPEGKVVLRIGPQVLSYHRMAPYIGWTGLRPELDRVIESIFATVPDPTIVRLGLRYLNALRPDLHGINSLGDLDMKLTVADDVLNSSFNVNYSVNVNPQMSCEVRIASKEFIQGQVPPEMAAYIDVDVATPQGVQFTQQDDVRKWLVDAHETEKVEFFHLLPQQAIDRLEDK